MKYKGLTLGLTLGVLVLTGCATEAFRSAQASCRSEAYGRFPQSPYLDFETRHRSAWLPTGEVRCTTSNSNAQTITRCNPVNRMTTIAYPMAVMKDANEQARNAWVWDCARQQCALSHGNADCE